MVAAVRRSFPSCQENLQRALVLCEDSVFYSTAWSLISGQRRQPCRGDWCSLINASGGAIGQAVSERLP